MTATIGGMVEDAAARHPGARLRFPALREELGLAELVAGGLRRAGSLRRRGVVAGDTVGIMCRTSPEFLLTFLGAVRMGAVAVPMPLPPPGALPAPYWDGLERLVASARMRWLVASRSLDLAERWGAAGGPPTEVLVAEELDRPPAPARDLPAPGPDDLAVLQYTSGTTRSPRGVMLSHRNVVHGVDAIVEGLEATAHDVHVEWLPLFHDMGLVSMLAGVRAGCTQHLWPSTSFVKSPEVWLRGFADCGGTIHVGPNFSYDLMLAAGDGAPAGGRSLGAWRVALNGAEPVSPRTLEDFFERFGPAGVRASAMLPVYGLAEATLAVTFSPLREPPSVQWVDRDALGGEGRAVEVARSDARSRGIVNVGRPVRGIDVRVADVDGRPLEERRVGEVQVRGRAVTGGYFGLPEETAHLFCGGWLRTGDLGYLSGGDLYVSGRLKDMITVSGRNFYAEDVEEVARPVPGVHRGHCVAFALAEEERMGVLVETRLVGREERRALCHDVRHRISETLGLGDAVVRAVGPGALPRTSSGKFQRRRARDLLMAGAPDVPGG